MHSIIEKKIVMLNCQVACEVYLLNNLRQQGSSLFKVMSADQLQLWGPLQH